MFGPITLALVLVSVTVRPASINLLTLIKLVAAVGTCKHCVKCIRVVALKVPTWCIYTTLLLASTIGIGATLITSTIRLLLRITCLDAPVSNIASSGLVKCKWSLPACIAAAVSIGTISTGAVAVPHVPQLLHTASLIIASVNIACIAPLLPFCLNLPPLLFLLLLLVLVRVPPLTPPAITWLYRQLVLLHLPLA